MADSQTCACPDCNHQVETDEAVMSDGKAYCCDACASGHPNGIECKHNGCGCEQSA